MEYMELLKQMIAECRNDAERYLSGDKQDYLYCLEKDEKYGNTDSNYTNRTRLCYGLMYGEFEPESIEDAVRELFVSEVISRENESFQGIGVNIEMLSACSVPLPSISEQIEIASYLDIKCSEIDRLIESKQHLLIQLEAYKKSVVYEYVTGKREVVG